MYVIHGDNNKFDMYHAALRLSRNVVLDIWYRKEVGQIESQPSFDTLLYNIVAILSFW